VVGDGSRRRLAGSPVGRRCRTGSQPPDYAAEGPFTTRKQLLKGLCAAESVEGCGCRHSKEWPMTKQLKTFIDGAHVEPADGRYSDLIDPSTGEVFASAPVSGE